MVLKSCASQPQYQSCEGVWSGHSDVLHDDAQLWVPDVLWQGEEDSVEQHHHHRGTWRGRGRRRERGYKSGSCGLCPSLTNNPEHSASCSSKVEHRNHDHTQHKVHLPGTGLTAWGVWGGEWGVR